jgi:hypothetical protein
VATRRLVDVRNGVVIFTPPPRDPIVVSREDFRNKLDDARPVFVEASLDDVIANPQAWYGEYAAPNSAGWIALLSAAAADRRGQIRLGNLSSLGFRKTLETDALWTVRKAGAISVRAIGLTRGFLEGNWRETAGFRLPQREFSSFLENAATDYLIAVEIDASIDPKVIVGPGTVFEQVAPNTAQNLAVAHEWNHTIPAGDIIGALLPAYCLNRNLPGPSGQPIRVTPLTFTGNLRSQRDLWNDVEERNRPS